MCGNCNSKSLRILEGPNGEKVAHCPLDDLTRRLPRKGEMNFKDTICPLCSFQVQYSLYFIITIIKGYRNKE